tara:strand:- start:4767 stop:5585 length:819 start_codon:yes stop_codon:yes gene_type:complete
MTSFFKSFVVDNVVGPIESTLLSERQYLQRQTARALETIRDDVTPSESIQEIYQRFRNVLERHSVREKLKQRIIKYLTEHEDQDAVAQELFEDIKRNCKDAIPFVNDLLWSSNYLLFFNNNELYSIYNTNLENMYKNLTREHQLEFAPKVFKTHGHLLRILDEEDRSKPLCINAVESFGPSLEHVPENLKSKHLVTLAVQESGYALEYAQKKFQRDLVCVAYKRAGRNILGHSWFQKIFNKLTKKERQECIRQEIDARNDAANKWWTEEYSH